MKNKTTLISVSARFLEDSELEAFAAERDPYKTWIHFILTDDKPNKNNQRIPKEEFASLEATAKFMPIKKIVGGIGDVHDGAVPMGSIAETKITENDHISRLEALAALWTKEYPDDIAHLKYLFDEGTPINFSWEVGYQTAEEDIEYPGVEKLTGCSMRAATIVGMPAYGDRTRTLAMAAEEAFEDRIEKVSTILSKVMMSKDGESRERYWLRKTYLNSAVVKDNMDGIYYRIAYAVSDEGLVVFDYSTAIKVTQQYIEAHKLDDVDLDKDEPTSKHQLQQMKDAVKDLGTASVRKKLGGFDMKFKDLKELKELFKGLKPEDQANAALDGLSDLFDEFETLKTERDTLHKEKEEREEEDRRAQVLKDRLSSLKEAGIEYSDDELEARAKSLIDMTDDAFDLFIKELAALTERISEEDPEKVKETGASVRVPKTIGKTGSKKPLDIIKETLTEAAKKKEEGK